MASADAVRFATGLAEHGDQVALITPAGPVTYRDLADRARAVARQLGAPQELGGQELDGPRRLVLIEGANTAGTIAAYLGAMSAGHPVLLCPAEAAGAMTAA